MLRTLIAGDRVEIRIRPSFPTACTTGDICTRPSRRRVARTALWLCLKCSSASAKSIIPLPRARR